MTKLAFLSALRARLGVLHASEINDIIDEYSGYIDSKIDEGKTEEEAVNDFGSMDDLVDEILDAYKINKDYSKSFTPDEKELTDHSQETSTKQDKKSQSKQPIFEDFIDTLGDVIGQVVEALTSFFRHSLQGFSVENLAQLLVVFFIAMIIIAVFKIPFSIIESLGKSLIYFVLPYRLHYWVQWLWIGFVNIVYVLMAVLVIGGLIQGVVEKKDLGESMRDVFRRSSSSIQWHRSSLRGNRHRNARNNSNMDTEKDTLQDISKMSDMNANSNNGGSRNTSGTDVSNTNSNHDTPELDGHVSSDVLSTSEQATVDAKTTPPAMVVLDDLIDMKAMIAEDLGETGLSKDIEYTQHDVSDADEDLIDDDNVDLEVDMNDAMDDDKEKDESVLTKSRTASDDPHTSSSRQYRRQEKQRRQEERHPHKEHRGFIGSMHDLMFWMFKFFVFCLLLPVYGLILGAALGIGVVIYLLFQGISLFGFLLLGIGGLAFLSLFVNIIWESLNRGRTYRFPGMKAAILTCCVVIGFGSITSFFDLMRFEHKPLEVLSEEIITKEVMYYELTQSEQYFEFNTSSIEFAPADDLEDDNMRVTISYDATFTSIHEYVDSHVTHLYVSRHNNSFVDFKNNFDAIFQGLRENIVYYPTQEVVYKVMIEANPATLEKLDIHFQRVVYRK